MGCEVCGVGLHARKSNTRFCSSACRSEGWRRKNWEHHTPNVPRHGLQVNEFELTARIAYARGFSDAAKKLGADPETIESLVREAQ
jgi:hypothetical protein